MARVSGPDNPGFPGRSSRAPSIASSMATMPAKRVAGGGRGMSRILTNCAVPGKERLHAIALARRCPGTPLPWHAAALARRCPGTPLSWHAAVLAGPSGDLAGGPAGSSVDAVRAGRT